MSDLAGDEYVRSVPLIELKGCDELIEGMSQNTLGVADE